VIQHRIIRVRKLTENHYSSGMNMRLDGNADATDVRSAARARILMVRSGAKERPQVIEPVEQVPHVRRSAPFPVRVQVGQRGVLTVALEGRPGFPLDEDEYLPGSDVACRALPEPAQDQHAPSVPGDLPG
jgi:hypothetical protein